MIEERHLRRYAGLFCHQREVYAVQKKDGRYVLVRRPITAGLLRRHLEGDVTCGWYALRRDHTLRWVAVDADREDGLEALQQIWERLDSLNLAVYLETSRRGGHLWLFVEGMPAWVMRTLMRAVVDGIPKEFLHQERGAVEIYPRQDEVPVGGVGSLVRGPLGVHRLTGERYYFLDPAGWQPIGLSLADQLDYLLSFQVNSSHQVAEALAGLITDRHPPGRQSRLEAPAGPPFEGGDTLPVLKAVIGDLYAFVSQYVVLDAGGRGSCPFHPPDRHPSFAVNRKEGYWVCFHETNPHTGRYLGGDAIEFYRRLKGLSFKEAVRDLAAQYGVSGLPF